MVEQYQFNRFTCLKKWRETEGVYSFIWARNDNAPIFFQPGQFVLLRANIDGQRVMRCYSIAGQPEPSQLMLTVQSVSGGKMSGWLNQQLETGAQADLSLPQGSMTLEHVKGASNLIMASAGCGIVPMRALLKAALMHTPAPEVRFIHCAQDISDVIYLDELLALDAAHPNLTLELYLKAASSEFAGAKTHRFGFQQACELVPEPEQTAVFLCGSDRFTTPLTGFFTATGVPAARIRSESFGAGVASDLSEIRAGQVSVFMPVLNHFATVERGTPLITVLGQMGAPVAGGDCDRRVNLHRCTVKVAEMPGGQVRTVNACQYQIETDINLTLL